MSKCHVGKLKCSNCGNVQSFTFWESINSSLDPQLKDRLTRGELTSWVCEKCGVEAHILFNCLYHDMEKRVQIWLRYSDDRTTEESSVTMEKMTQYLFNEGYKLRTVRSFPDLVDKIRIFDDQFSDFLIELVKLIACFREGIEPSIPMYYGGLKTGDSGETELRLILRIDGKLYNRGYPFPKCLEAAEATMPMLTKHFNTADKWPQLDRLYVLEALKKAGLVDSGL
jgi:hypothetical protein